MKGFILLRWIGSLTLIFLLAGAMDRVPGLMTANALAPESPGTKEVVLRVEGMTCSLCPYTVQRALKRLPGVVKARASYPEGMARVTYREGEVSIDQIIHTIRNLGYPASLDIPGKGGEDHGP